MTERMPKLRRNAVYDVQTGFAIRDGELMNGLDQIVA